MPEQFAPEWEYYTPDPEVEELINESGRLRNGSGRKFIENLFGVVYTDNGPIAVFTFTTKPGRSCGAAQRDLAEAHYEKVRASGAKAKEEAEVKSGKKFKACRWCSGPVIPFTRKTQCRARYLNSVRIYCSRRCSERASQYRTKYQNKTMLISPAEWERKRRYCHASPRSRLWFVLQYLEGMTQQEIADLFGVSRQAVTAACGSILTTIRNVRCTSQRAM